MKKRFLLLFLAVISFTVSNAQLKKVYETECNISDIRGAGSFNGCQIVAGSKKLNVLQISDGKMLIDKTYAQSGSSVGKVYNAGISANGILVVCNTENTVCGIDIKTGDKIWEVNSFKEIGNDLTEVMCVYGNYVLVSDKKGKDNFSLTALDVNSGKIVWSLEKEPDQVNLLKSVYLKDAGLVCFTNNRFSNRKKAREMRFMNIATGNVEFSTQVTGYITNLLANGSENLFVHTYIDDDNTSLINFNLKEKKIQWTAKLANKTKSNPMTAKCEFYVSLNMVAGNVIIATEGIEAFDVASGKSLYNIPYKPYVEWGVGDYINSIFEPVVTPDGKSFVIADVTDGDVAIKKIDGVNGKELWSTGKLKGKEVTPRAYMTDNSVIVQFGGAVTFEVINNTDIGKLVDPYGVVSYDLASGKPVWTLDSRETIYRIFKEGDVVVVCGSKNLQFLDAATGKVTNSQKEPFKETYFMTKVGLSRVKYQKGVVFDFAEKTIFTAEDDSFVKYSF